MYPFCIFFIVEVKVHASSLWLIAGSKGLNTPDLTFDPWVCEKSKSKSASKKKIRPGRNVMRHAWGSQRDGNCGPADLTPLMHRVHTATTMAIDRGRRSINKLTGTVFAAVSCCILATCALQISASKNELLNDTWPINVVVFSDIDQPPTSVITYLGEQAAFQCSIGETEGNILWYVDDVYVLGLPLEYEAFFMRMSTADYVNSTLHLRAVEQANNSQIICAVRINKRENRTYFPSAILQVQGNTWHVSKDWKARGQGFNMKPWPTDFVPS